MPNVYDFRPGRSVKNVNPQSLGDWLEQLRAQHGQLTPALVLEAAAPEDSPGHAAFEWDDTEAARQHRLSQARRLIVSIRVLNSPIQPPAPAFISVRTPDKGRSYVPAVEALSDEQLAARILQEARQFIESLERRYAHFRGAVEVLSKLKANVA